MANVKQPILFKPENEDVNKVLKLNGLELKLYDRIKKGRPKEYTPEIAEKAREYIFQDWDGEWGRHADRICPNSYGLALFLNTTRPMLYYWAETNEDFLDSLVTLNHMEVNLNYAGGLSKRFDSRFAAQVLGSHGVINTQQNANDGSQQTNVQVNIIAQQIDADTIARIMGNADFALPNQIQNTNVIDVDDDED